MSWLVSHFMPWIAVSLLLGLTVGWICAERRQPSAPRAGVVIGLFVAAIAIWIAFTHILPGRVGLGFEIFLLLVVGYLFGVIIGEPLRLALAPPVDARRSSSQDDAAA